jgi:2-polyprenyl-6-methoxyphenol hydroxylase-like FAD-dependent oxidoreductase
VVARCVAVIIVMMTMMMTTAATKSTMEMEMAMAMATKRKGVARSMPWRFLLRHPELGPRRPDAARGFDRCQHHRCLSTLQGNKKDDHYRPVVIVGGGPCGLLMSLYLSKYRVPSTLFDRQTPDERFRHPQAHFLNTRTMEILRFDFPAVYRDVQRAMPPVHQWKNFVFCTSVFGDGSKASSSQVLARVEHPVAHPLVANRDANGRLGSLPSSSEDARDAFLSLCSVGHLAQHEFCRILYRHAITNEKCNDACGKLQYGRTVTGIDFESARQQGEGSTVVVVHTSDSSYSVTTPLVVAADGARSFVRGQAGIGQLGSHSIQHLVNVHVTVDPQVASRLHEQESNYGMLYSIFNPHVIAMVVCHDANKGEYVIQIPYFPPYQTWDEDFAPSKLQTMLSAIFGPRVSPASVRIRSVRPWTMGSLVSVNFFKSNRLALVGDAAHAFPPSGGLGMNTGLQDVQNLAWRIARDYHAHRRPRRQQGHWDDGPLNNHDNEIAVGGIVFVSETTLKSYERERQVVAKQNAALSTRNYRRLLEVHKSFHLNDRHPELLARALDATPIVPLGAKRHAFRLAFRAALQPLAALQQPPQSIGVWGPSQLYRDHIVQSLRQVLDSGAGLPLLFPKYELGFGYSCRDSNQEGVREQHLDDPQDPRDGADQTGDTWAETSSLKVGYLVPHVRVHVVSSFEEDAGGKCCFPHLVWIDSEEVSDIVARKSSRTISTSNLPSQLATECMPVFVLLVVGSIDLLNLDIPWMVERLKERLRLEVQVVQILRSSSSSAPTFNTAQSMNEPSSHSTSSTRWPERRLVLQELPSAFSFFRDNMANANTQRKWDQPYVVLVRPDSHIHGISSLDALDESSAASVLLGSSYD